MEAAASAILGLVSVLAIMAVIGPEAFGRASLAIWTVTLIEVALAAGLYDAVLRSRSAHTRFTDTLFWARVGLGGLAMLVSLAVASVSDRLFSDPGIAPLMAAYSIACVLNAFAETPSALLTRKYRFAVIARIVLTGRAAGVAVGVAAAFGGAGGWSLIAASLTTSLVTAILFQAQMPRRPRLRFEVREARRVLAFSTAVGLDNVLQAVAARSVPLLVGSLHGVTAAGYFGFALRLLDEAGGLITRVAFKSAYPYFAEARRSGADLAEAYVRATRVYLVLILPIIGGLALVAQDAVPVIFGVKWQAAAPLLQVLALATLIAAQAQLSWPLLRVTGRQNVLVAITASDAALGIAICLVTANQPLLVLAAGLVMKTALLQPVLLMIVARTADIRWRALIRAVLPPALALVAMAVAVLLAGRTLPPSPSLARLVVLIATGAVVYPMVLLALDRGLLLRLKREAALRLAPLTGRLNPR